MTEFTLGERLAQVDEEIRGLQAQKARMIEREPVTFANLRHPTWGTDRYVIVFADGTPTLMTYQQRPAALARAQQPSQVQEGETRWKGYFVWDRRAGEILTGGDGVIARVEHDAQGDVARVKLLDAAAAP